MDEAAKILGQDLVIVHKQGGGARSAHEYAMAQPADGYVVVAFTPTHLYSIARGNSPASIDDFTGLAPAMQAPSVIVVRSDSAIDTYEQAIANSQDNPLNWGAAPETGRAHVPTPIPQAQR